MTSKPVQGWGDCPGHELQPAELVRVRARLARSGIAPVQLQRWECPDTERMVDPMNEHETQVELRRLVADLWNGAL